MTTYLAKTTNQVALTGKHEQKPAPVNIIEPGNADKKADAAAPASTDTTAANAPGSTTVNATGGAAPATLSVADTVHNFKPAATGNATNPTQTPAGSYTIKVPGATTGTTNAVKGNNPTQINSTLTANTKGTGTTTTVNINNGLTLASKQANTTATADGQKPLTPVRPDDKDKNVSTRNESANTLSREAAPAAYSSDMENTFKKNAVAEKKEIVTTVKENVTVDEAMQSFNSADYKKASDQFDKILKQQPDNADALYFGGISDYINGKNSKSEKNFDKLLKTGNKYIDGSKWYKANILIKKGNSEEAKVLLQQLANTNGSYRERAVKRIAELGF
jgi:hypothetical protein